MKGSCRAFFGCAWRKLGWQNVRQLSCFGYSDSTWLKWLYSGIEWFSNMCSDPFSPEGTRKNDARDSLLRVHRSMTHSLKSESTLSVIEPHCAILGQPRTERLAMYACTFQW